MLKNFNVIHIASFEGSKSAGAEVAVINHVKYQSKYSNVLLLNCGTYQIDTSKYKNKVVNYDKNFSIDSLPSPFNAPDIIIFHSIYYPKYLKLAKQARSMKIPYIVIPHGGLQIQAQKTKKMKKMIGNFLLFNKFLHNAIAIQYLCEAEEQNSIKKNQNFIISGNGYNVSDLHKEYCGDLQGLKFIFVGRYDIYFKGLDLLIDAVNNMKSFFREKNLVLNLYGEKNKDYKILKDMVTKFKIEDIVHLNGGIFEKEKIKEILSSDLFIQTSRSEGQPLGIIEAISLGMPCILTKETNFGVIAQENNFGWCIDFNEESLKNAIVEAYDKRDCLDEMSEKAYQYAKNYLSWDNISMNAIKLYKNLIGLNAED